MYFLFRRRNTTESGPEEDDVLFESFRDNGNSVKIFVLF